MMVTKIPTFVLPSTLLASLERDLRALSPTLQGEPVASVRPWSVIATTESPAIMIPVDGEQAFADALKFYDVRWLILSNESRKFVHKSAPARGPP
jgi:hypothetical protein